MTLIILLLGIYYYFRRVTFKRQQIRIIYAFKTAIKKCVKIIPLNLSYSPISPIKYNYDTL